MLNDPACDQQQEGRKREQRGEKIEDGIEKRRAKGKERRGKGEEGRQKREDRRQNSERRRKRREERGDKTDTWNHLTPGTIWEASGGRGAKEASRRHLGGPRRQVPGDTTGMPRRHPEAPIDPHDAPRDTQETLLA